MPVFKAPSTWIVPDEQGRPVLAGTRTKVIEVVLDHLAHGRTPKEIHVQHDRRLPMAQIHAALAYYFEDQPEMDAEIEEGLGETDRLRAEAGESPFLRRVRSGMA